MNSYETVNNILVKMFRDILDIEELKINMDGAVRWHIIMVLQPDFSFILITVQD